MRDMCLDVERVADPGEFIMITAALEVIINNMVKML
jgi:hypothetical protein